MDGSRLRGIWLLGLMIAASLLPARLSAGGAAVVLSGNLSSYEEAAAGFRGAFDEAVKEYRLSSSGIDSAVLRDIRFQSPKIILAVGSQAAVEAAHSFPGVPVIYCMVVNPDRQGLLNKDNVYGIGFSIEESELFAKFREALPNLKRLGLIVDRHRDREWIERIAGLGRKAGMEIVVERAGSKTEVPNAMRSLSGRMDAFWMTTDSSVSNKFAFDTVSDFCLKSRIPLLVPVESLVAAGGLMSVTSGAGSIGAQAASLARELLDGKRPRESLARPAKIDVTVNLETARKIGATISDPILRNAAVVR